MLSIIVQTIQQTVLTELIMEVMTEYMIQSSTGVVKTVEKATRTKS